MKIKKHPYPIHCCLFDKECWEERSEFGMPMGLYFNFIERKDRAPVFFTLLPAKDLSALGWELVEVDEMRPRNSEEE